MRAYSLTHLSDAVLLADLAEMVRRESATTAELLACIAEVDARRLFLGVGYPSMYAYCVDHLHLSEHAAYKRIQAARVARRFPQVFAAVAAGRIHLTGIMLLAPYLKPGNIDELLAESLHQRKAEIERRLAERFPRTELMTIVEVLPPASCRGAEGAAAEECAAEKSVAGPVGNSLLAPERGRHYNDSVNASAKRHDARNTDGEQAARLVPAVLHSSHPPSRVTPLAPQRYALHLTIAQSTHDKLLHALALLSHVLPSGDVAQVLDRALDLLIHHLERRKLGADHEPRARPRLSPNARYVPKHVRRAVWARDEGRCTFVSDTGHRCEERRFLEFDHIDPVARGGLATVDRIRLRCRAHNQYAAERAFGRKFMEEKRGNARGG